MIVAKYTAAGTYVWARTFPSSGSGGSLGIAVDGAGNVYLTGYFSGFINFGTGNLNSVGSYDIFVAKFTNTGATIWAKTFGSTPFTTPTNEAGLCIAADSAGNAVVGGNFIGTVNFGVATLTVAGSSTSTDGFLLKLASASGAPLWVKQIGDVQNGDAVKGVAVDSGDNIIATGTYNGTVDFGTGPLASGSGYNIFIAKYNSSGTCAWARSYGATGNNTGNAVAVDSAGAAYVTGAMMGTINFGGGNMTANGFYPDVFVLKLNSSGTFVWAKRYNGANSDFGNGIAVGPDGTDVAVVGSVFAPTDFGLGNVSGFNTYDVFVAKHAAVDGALQWAKIFGNTNIDEAKGVAIDSAHNILMTGSYTISINFGGAVTHTSAGQRDIFLAKLGP